MDMDKPAMKFNLVIYRNEGKRLENPRFIPNVYVQSGNNDEEIYAYDAAVFDAQGEDSVIAVMKALSHSYKYGGIWIDGIELRNEIEHGETIRDWQTWLVTTLTEKELAEEKFFRH